MLGATSVRSTRCRSRPRVSAFFRRAFSTSIRVAVDMEAKIPTCVLRFHDPYARED
jgi:hypothetical protein